MEKEKKLSIIKAAVKRFAKHGPSKTTLDEIARDLRIGKATIYHYFESKDELFFDTLKWESSLFLEELKANFNNEAISIKERFINYFLTKEALDQKYKLLYELVVRFLKEEILENEIEIIISLIKKEEEILTLILGSIYREKIETMNPLLPYFVVMQSWGFLFGGKLNNIGGRDIDSQNRDFLYKCLEKIIE